MGRRPAHGRRKREGETGGGSGLKVSGRTTREEERYQRVKVMSQLGPKTLQEEIKTAYTQIKADVPGLTDLIPLNLLKPQIQAQSPEISNVAIDKKLLELERKRIIDLQIAYDHTKATGREYGIYVPERGLIMYMRWRKTPEDRPKIRRLRRLETQIKQQTLHYKKVREVGTQFEIREAKQTLTGMEKEKRELEEALGESYRAPKTDFVAKHFGHGSENCEECGNIIQGTKYSWDGQQLCLNCYRKQKMR